MQNTSQPVVLVVDDDPVIRELYSVGLEDLGFCVVEASNGKEALAKLEEQRPDAVVLDMAMPEASGLTVIQALRAKPGMSDVPVIAVTGLDPDDDLWGGHEWGWDLYLRKPVDLDELGAHLRKFIGR